MAIGSVNYGQHRFSPAFPYGPPGQQELASYQALGNMLSGIYNQAQQTYQQNQQRQLLSQLLQAPDREAALATLAAPQGNQFGNLIFGGPGTDMIQGRYANTILGQLLEDPIAKQSRELDVTGKKQDIYQKGDEYKYQKESVRPDQDKLREQNIKKVQQNLSTGALNLAEMQRLAELSRAEQTFKLGAIPGRYAYEKWNMGNEMARGNQDITRERVRQGREAEDREQQKTLLGEKVEQAKQDTKIMKEKYLSLIRQSREVKLSDIDKENLKLLRERYKLLTEKRANLLVLKEHDAAKKLKTEIDKVVSDMDKILTAPKKSTTTEDLSGLSSEELIKRITKE